MLHPYFTSGLDWHVSLSEVLGRGQKIFIVHGHRHCSGTRALVERTLAKEEVEEMVQKHFLAVAGDADALTPELAALIEKLPKREPTPLCIYLDSDGKLLLSTAGGRPAAVLLNDMLGAISKK